jgi:hypothetical protein
MRHHRIGAVQPMRVTLLEQMNVPAHEGSDAISALATVLITAVERTITMATDASLSTLRAHGYPGQVTHAAARVLALGIQEGRRLARAEQRAP